MLYVEPCLKTIATYLSCSLHCKVYTGELGYDRLNGTRKIGPSYAKTVVNI